MTQVLSDVAAERAVLSGIFQGGADTYIDIADIITNKTFTDNAHAVLYGVMEHALKNKDQKHLDLATLWSAADDLGVGKMLRKSDDQHVIRAILNFPVRPENVRRLAAKVRKLEVARTLGSTLDEAKENLLKITGDEPISHILGLAEQPIIDFSTLLSVQQENEPRRIGEGLRDYVKYLASNPVKQVGIPSGFPRFDRAIGGGFRRKTVSVIGARPKTGKSVAAASIAVHVAGQLGVPVFMLDTEMAREDQWHRLLAKFSRVTIDDIETGQFASDPRKLAAVDQAVAFLENAPFDYLSIAGQPFEDTIAAMRRWVLRKVGQGEGGRTKDCLLIFDYLKLMSSEAVNEALKEYQILGFMMTALHNFVHKYDVPCLSFVQLNRDGIDKESTDVVSQSDRIIWLCSNFSIYKKKSDDEMAEERAEGRKNIGTRKLIPIVSRHGEGLEDGDYIDMKFEGRFATITEGQTRREQQRDGFEVSKNESPVEFS